MADEKIEIKIELDTKTVGKGFEKIKTDSTKTAKKMKRDFSGATKDIKSNLLKNSHVFLYDCLLQHSPIGISFPCGHFLGCLSIVQSASVNCLFI